MAGTHTMKVPPPSEQPVTEEEDQAFLTPSSRRKKRSLAARRAALRPWVMSIGLTVLVAVAAVAAYTLGASIGSWNDRPSTAATPCRAATRSAPTESSGAPPSSVQKRTQSRSYLKKPKKTGSSELSVSDRVFVGGCG